MSVKTELNTIWNKAQYDRDYTREEFINEVVNVFDSYVKEELAGRTLTTISCPTCGSWSEPGVCSTCGMPLSRAIKVEFR